MKEFGMFQDFDQVTAASLPYIRREPINVLLVGDLSTDAGDFKTKLCLTAELPFIIHYSPRERDAIDLIRQRDHHIEIIFLDLTSSGETAKKYFLELKKGIPDIPIIAFTSCADYELINFVMNNGAAETVSQWKIRSDPDRLIGIVESCLARNMVSKNAASMERGQITEPIPSA
ncbi:MAG: hypothetical protein ACAH80_02290 [Alphaproteobacteria bacterium]